MGQEVVEVEVSCGVPFLPSQLCYLARAFQSASIMVSSQGQP